MMLAVPASGINDFAFNLYRSLNSESPETNIFISPISASTAIALLNAGAEGTTSEEICSMLGFEGQSSKEIDNFYKSLNGKISAADPSSRFESANSIWVSKDIHLKGNYVSRARKFYDAKVSGVDFSSYSSVDAINRWCSDKTEGKIHKIIREPDPNLKLMLVNALYFKAAWNFSRFPIVKDETFRRVGGAESPQKMMYKDGKFFYAKDDIFSIIEIPYGNGTFAMYILLPEDESEEGFRSAVEAVTADRWDSLTGMMNKKEVHLAIPKFKIEYEALMNDALMSLGMMTAFTPAADLSGISSAPLMVSFVKQKACLDVNEEGTEAAAVTSIGIKLTSMRQEEEPVIFRADRPFIFTICDRSTGAVLFIGQKVQ